MNNDINNALEVLRKGGVILYPTDTIWGLGCDATNPEAIKKIFNIKERVDNKSMIILMDSVNRLGIYVEDVPDAAYDLIELSEKPLTVILEGAKSLAYNVINRKNNSVGVRVVNDKFCQQLIQRFKKPIVSTSANISGKASPACFDDINSKIIEQVDYVVEHRQADISKAQPSSIIKINHDSTIKIIRE